jgi:hypothetical protein
MSSDRTYRAGQSIEDYCRACKTDRIHNVMATDGSGHPIRVMCGYCRSEHNYRGGPRIDSDGTTIAATRSTPPAPKPVREPFPLVSDRERITPAMSSGSTDDLELLLRRIIREETGLTPATPADKWRGGTLTLKPGTPGLQEKSWPIETFFNKIVMLRNRLRTLEQQINASDLPDDVKIKVQSYITGCYGSLTSFNVLFSEESDQFKGAGRDTD